MSRSKKSAVITNDRLMKEWDWEMNAELDPKKLTLGSGKRAFWRCKQGHVWEAEIYKRGVEGQNCPYCAKRRASREYNLKVLYPEIASEWDVGFNATLKPEKVTPKSNKKVYWRCSACGRQYKAAVCDRTVNGSACPYCAGKSVIPGFNDVATTHPELMELWYWQRNDELGLDPTVLGAGSHNKVWWYCTKCHRPYIRSVLVQVRVNGNCPYCTGRRRGLHIYKYI